MCRIVRVVLRLLLSAASMTIFLIGLSMVVYAQPESTASITGTVQDAQEAAIPQVPVLLTSNNNSIHQTVETDTKGAYRFTSVPPGTYVIKVDAPGLEPFTSPEIVLNAGEKREFPIVVTRIPVQETTVHVNATLAQVAQAQVQQQEQQRVLGIFPDFYTSYIWTAAPMTPKLKFQLALRYAIDPMTFVTAAAVAGFEQKRNLFPGYGQGVEGYAKRFGASYADTVTSRIISRAILPTVFHQDPRYFYRGTGSVHSRLWYAISQTFVCRGDNGEWEPNYSQLLGNFTAAGLSNIYRSPGDRKASVTIRDGFIITGSGIVENVLREFLSRKLTPHVPAFANGKP